METTICDAEQDSDTVDISEQGVDSGLRLNLHDEWRYTGVAMETDGP
jgi:hypothetical protein